MNWLNLPVTVARNPAFIGCEPVARATWLSVLLYCVDQENGGVLKGARAWKDRQWQQTCGVTMAEVDGAGPLLAWKGDNLVVAFYPKDKQKEVQRLRAQAGSAAGRRWQKRAMPSPMPQGIPEGIRAGDAEGMPSGYAERERKEKGKKEGERERGREIEGKSASGAGGVVGTGGGNIQHPITHPQTPPPCEVQLRSSVRSQVQLGNERGISSGGAGSVGHTDGAGCMGGPPAAPKRAPADTDEPWMASVVAMDCYQAVNVRIELGKAQAWCGQNHRVCTRKFFINWLNRAVDNHRAIAGPGRTGGVGRTDRNAALHKTPSRFGF